MTTRARRVSLKKLLLGTAILLVVIQLVPYGRRHTNPPVVAEPAWDRPATRELVSQACFDCHSNETRWPAYASAAPSSWLVQNDVDGGRAHLNFSEWQRSQRHAKDAADEVRTKDMPPWYYAILHPKARLSDADRAQLVTAFEKMFGPKEPGDRERE
jgi:mono/diheme cytochrome c family protein